MHLREINRDPWVGIEVYHREEDIRVSVEPTVIKSILELDVLHAPLELITEREGSPSF